MLFRSERTFHGRHLGNRLAVVVVQPAASRNDAAEILLGQDQRPIDEVAEHGNELVVVAGLEILPGEVVVLGLGSVGAEHVTQHILLAGELVEILVQPDGPVARSGNLVALEVEKLVGRHVSYDGRRTRTV